MVNLRIVLICFALVGCVQATEPRQYPGWQPIRDGELNIVEIPDAAESIEKFVASISDIKIAPGIRSILISHNKNLAAEWYVNGPDQRSEVDNLKSVTKSIVSMLTGIAIRQGYFTTDSTLNELIPNYTVDSDLRVHDALIMDTGINYLNGSDNRELLIDRPEDSVSFVLERPREPRGYHYHDGNPHLIGEVIRTSSRQSLESFAENNLFSPLGIDTYLWEKYSDGRAFGGFGLYLRPRDLLKVGHTMLDSANEFEGRIVSAEWYRKSTSGYIEAWPTQEFGYYWWLHAEGISARGHGGQYLIIEPENQLVVVVTTNPYVVDTQEVGIPFDVVLSALEGLRKALPK